MSTEFFNDQWRIPSNENQNKVSNYSCKFDSVANNSISLGNTLTNGFSELTVSVWANFSSLPGRLMGLISKDLTNQRSFEIRYNSSGVNFIVSTNGSQIFLSSVYPKNSINIGQWYNFIGVYDGSNILFYVDGILIGTPTALTGSLQNTTSELNIGLRSASPSATTFDGKIDQVSIFDYALPATGTNSIATLYGGGNAVTNPMALSPKPIAYYQLGDQSVDNGANYLVPNNSLQDYVFDYGFTSGNSYTAIQTNDLSSLSAISISTWFKYNSGIASFSNLFNLEGNIKLLNWTSTAQIRFQGSGGSTDRHIINTTFEVDRWYNLTLTYNGTSAKCYIDGDISKGFDVTASNLALTSSQNKFNIGSSTSNSNRWDGFISNTAMFNYELTNSQAVLIYNNGTPSDLTSLSPIGWWKQNSNDIFITNNIGSVNFTIIDYGSDSNNGNMINAVSGSLQQGNLQHVSGFSPYALDFSGITAHLKTNTIPAQTNTVTLSAWVKRTGDAGSSAGVFGVRNSGGPSGTFGVSWDLAFLTTTNKIEFRIADTTYRTVAQNTAMPDNTWTHVAGVADGTNIKLYINGVLQTDTDTYSSNLLTPSTNIRFAAQGPSGSNPFNGQLSNCARWNVGLTQAEVTEIYNQGVPSNLNTFSGTAPIGWWQLGSNSSFEGNDWTCLDEIGTDNADSGATAMSNDDIVNGVGYSANGLGTSSIEIKGDAPYSTANGLSNSMDVLDRSTDVAPT